MTSNICLKMDFFNTELIPADMDLIIVDPDCGWELDKHKTWIKLALQSLREGGFICITGHPEQKLFKIEDKNNTFMILKKINNDEYDSTYFTSTHKTGSMDWYHSIKEVITRYCPKKGKVVDLFAGKGTASFAAKVMGRDSLGIEWAEEKVILINKKLNDIKEGEDVSYDTIFG